MSMNLKVAIILLRSCLKVAIYFIRILVTLCVVCVSKCFVWLVKHISIVFILLRTIAIPLTTTSFIILFILLFSSLLDGAFSIASTVLARVVIIALKPNLMSICIRIWIYHPKF